MTVIFLIILIVMVFFVFVQLKAITENISNLQTNVENLTDHLEDVKLKFNVIQKVVEDKSASTQHQVGTVYDTLDPISEKVNNINNKVSSMNGIVCKLDEKVSKIVNEIDNKSKDVEAVKYDEVKPKVNKRKKTNKPATESSK